MSNVKYFPLSPMQSLMYVVNHHPVSVTQLILSGNALHHQITSSINGLLDRKDKTESFMDSTSESTEETTNNTEEMSQSDTGEAPRSDGSLSDIINSDFPTNEYVGKQNIPMSIGYHDAITFPVPLEVSHAVINRQVVQHPATVTQSMTPVIGVAKSIPCGEAVW